MPSALTRSWMWLNLGVFLICSSTLTSSELIGDVVITVWTVSVVTDISVVTIAVDSVVVVVSIAVDSVVVVVSIAIDSVVVVVSIAIDSVVVTSVAVVVGVAGKLRVRGTVDIPRLMMVRVFPSKGVKVGASMPN